MATQRQERVGQLLREEISRIIERQLKDPRADGLITVTDVKVTPDLRQARVFVSILGSEEQAASSFVTIERAAGFIRAELAKQHLRLRHLPELEFRHDQTLAHAARIFELLEQAKGEPHPPDDAEDREPHTPAS